MFENLQRQLADHATDEAASATRVHTRCLRGIRGVPQGTLAKLIAESWRGEPPELPRDNKAIDTLFGTAWEDGLAAIGLLAAALPQDPVAAAALGLSFAERTDDVLTADSLGWLVLGPLLARLPPGELSGFTEALFGREGLAGAERGMTRRAVFASALAFTPAEIEGPASAALRESQGARQVRMVDGIVPEQVGSILVRGVRDGDPAVQKVLRKVIKIWAEHDPESLVRWAPTVRGGLPRMLADEVAKVKKPRPQRGGRGER